MPFEVGDRFEIPVTRPAWESGRVSLGGGLPYLMAETGEPTPVTLREPSGRSTPAVWDGTLGLLSITEPDGFAPLGRAAARLALVVEQASPPVFSIDLLSAAGATAAPATRTVGAVSVRGDPADAEVLAAFADGRHAPLGAWELNRWAHGHGDARRVSTG